MLKGNGSMEISLDIQDDVALIKMDDGKKNAITQAALADLEVAFDKAEADARAVVLAGRPGSFCAGFHLPTMTGDDKDAIQALSIGGGRLTLRLYAFPKPLVAACTGHGFTIGAIWMSACDTRIGEAGAFKHGMTETKLGMPLPMWALTPLKTRIAPQHWIPAIVQSRVYDPEGAVAAGFLDEIVPEGQSVDRACALAAEFAQLPDRTYAANKLVTRKEALEIMRADLPAD
jgi:enoyl-CoA hydratase